MLQRQNGLLVTCVEGEEHTGVFGSRDEDWHTRRRMLTPAFSAHKMKLVSVRLKNWIYCWCTIVIMHAGLCDHLDFFAGYVYCVVNSQILRYLGVCILFGTHIYIRVMGDEGSWPRLMPLVAESSNCCVIPSLSSVVACFRLLFFSWDVMLCNAFHTLKHDKMAPNDILCGMHGQSIIFMREAERARAKSIIAGRLHFTNFAKVDLQMDKVQICNISIILFVAIAVGLILFQVKWNLLLALNSINSQLLWYLWDSCLSCAFTSCNVMPWTLCSYTESEKQHDSTWSGMMEGIEWSSSVA